ncbi:hypothetical protein HPB50_011378 [Hyalomma asiaticum]|uniref:Uncharacterized protein n=1 Tax=Hyalomma asiaticum TaxID=266040 RepID=A0ACB7T9D3_HYAAI|nr:hypothetical protein HPB50_011378 [Hyalomma asiaticum]
MGVIKAGLCWPASHPPWLPNSLAEEARLGARRKDEKLRGETSLARASFVKWAREMLYSELTWFRFDLRKNDRTAKPKRQLHASRLTAPSEWSPSLRSPPGALLFRQSSMQRPRIIDAEAAALQSFVGW